MARTQQERKAETRRRLLDAAASLFARRGFHAASADAVADAAGRTSGALYAHFGGKEGLLVELLERWSGRAASVIAVGLGSARTTGERLRAVWAGCIDPPGELGDTWFLLEHELWLHAARDPEVGARLASRYAAARAEMAAAFDRWAEDASTSQSAASQPAASQPARGQDAATLVLALLFGLEMQHRVDPAAVPDDLAVAGMALLTGLDDTGRADPSDGEPADQPALAGSRTAG